MNSEMNPPAESNLSRSGSTAVNDDTLTQDAEQVEQSLRLSRRGGPPPGASAADPPAEVPGYTILRSLGEGAFGSVWLAREQNTGKQVAIKFYTHRRGLDWSLLNREVEKLAVLYTSRNIVGLLDVGWNSNPPYYVMEYLTGGSLASYLDGGPLPPHQAVRIAKAVLQALVHAHGSGILHCDLKPANVLLDADFSPRLCDFGQSRLSDEQNPALGTLFYMAPEQANLKAVPDARWDVYALGALLYHMLGGQPPFRSDETEQRIRDAETLDGRLAVYRQILREGPKPNRHRKVPGVDKRLADIVDRCLEVEPGKRYPNAQAVLDVLEIRDRQHSRRPLVILGFLGPLLLLFVMAFIVRDVMRNAVTQARENLTERALESDALSARILAQSLRRELTRRQSELVEIAADPALREAIQKSPEFDWPQRKKLFADLEKTKEQIDGTRDSLDRPRDRSWFVTNGQGDQIWRNPFSPNTIDKNYAFRHYFHGRNSLPENPQPHPEPFISEAFRSEATRQFMVAIRAPVWDEKHENVIGVLARTTHLGKLLEDYGRSIRASSGQDVNRVIALVDGRYWNLLDHPWMTENNLRRYLKGGLFGTRDGSRSASDSSPALRANRRSAGLPDETFEQLTLSGPIVEKLSHLREMTRTQQAPGGDSDRRPSAAWSQDHATTSDYQDPVGRIVPDTYGGKWLAAFAPVGETGWWAIVQERREIAGAPVDRMRAGLIRYGLWAFAVCCGLILLLWYFVQRELTDRSLRIWSRSESDRPIEVANGKPHQLKARR